MDPQCLSECQLKGKKVLHPKHVMKKLEKKKAVRKQVVKRVSPSKKAWDSFLIQQQFYQYLCMTISVMSRYLNSPAGSARDDHAIWRLLSRERSSEEGQAAQPPSCHALRNLKLAEIFQN
jgi:hypothetical protein